MTDLTLVLTAHDETTVSGPTMRSADLAVAEARLRGFTVQTIIALDKATDETTAYFSQPRFDHWERRVLHEGDLGRVRNALLPDTDGDLIAFLDADDLFSENWLAEGIAAIRSGQERGGVHRPPGTERALRPQPRGHPQHRPGFAAVHALLLLRAQLLRLAVHGAPRGARGGPLRAP